MFWLAKKCMTNFCWLPSSNNFFINTNLQNINDLWIGNINSTTRYFSLSIIFSGYVYEQLKKYSKIKFWKFRKGFTPWNPYYGLIKIVGHVFKSKRKTYAYKRLPIKINLFDTNFESQGVFFQRIKKYVKKVFRVRIQMNFFFWKCIK